MHELLARAPSPFASCPFTLVQVDSATQVSGAGPFSWSMTGTPQAGDVILLRTQLASTTVDMANAVSATNWTFTKIGWSHAARSITLWMGVAGASPGSTLTVTPSASTGITGLWSIARFKGFGASPVIYTSGFGTNGSSTTPTTPTLSLSGGRPVVVVGIYSNSTGNYVSGPDAPGWLPFTTLSPNAGGWGYQMVPHPAGSSFATQWTHSASGTWDAGICAIGMA